MIQCQEFLVRPRGHFKMTVKKAGKIIEVYEDKNLIVDNAKFLLAHLLAGETKGMSITKIGFGTNGGTPTPGDTVLKNPFLKPLNKISFPGYVAEEVNFGPVLGIKDDLVLPWHGYKVQFDWELMTTEDNGHSISEFGLITDNNALFARKSRGSPIVKAPDISIEGSWIITF